jgi:hypothetical protein
MSEGTAGAVTFTEYGGYRIALARLTREHAERESLVMRALAADSPFGLQEDLWEWRVLDGDDVLASDQEFSEVAALGGAKYWIRENRG